MDFDAAFDGGAVLEEGTMAVRDSIDEAKVCENCVKRGADALAYKPDLHQRQFQEIRRLELRAEHWEAYARRIEDAVASRPEPVVKPRARRSR